MSDGSPLGGGPLPLPTASNPPASGEGDRAKSFRDTVIDGSAWDEPAIDTDFALDVRDVTVLLSPLGPIVKYSDSFRAKLYKNWDNTLIIKPWGRIIGYRALNSRLARLWQLSSGFKLTFLEHNYYMVKFHSTDYMKVLTGGLWMILGLYLSVERWRPNFNPNTHRVSSVVAWVCIPGVPAKHYHVGVLRMVGDQIGRTVRIDIPTQQADRAQFARIAIELDLTKALESRVNFEGVWYHIVYEDIPQFCFECGMAGHSLVSCPSRVPPQPMPSTTPSQNQQEAQASAPNAAVATAMSDGPREYGDVTSEPKYGSWMLVSRKQGPKKNMASEEERHGKQAAPGGSRFQVLADSSEDNGAGLASATTSVLNFSSKATSSGAQQNSAATRRNKGKALVAQQQSLSQVSKRPRQSEPTFAPVNHARPPVQASTSNVTSSDKVVTKQTVQTLQPEIQSVRPVTKQSSLPNAPANVPIYAPANLLPSKPSQALPSNPPTSTGQSMGMEIDFDCSSKGHDVLHDKRMQPVRAAKSVDAQVPIPETVQICNEPAADGAGSDKFARATRELVRNHRPALLALVETKVLFSQAQPILLQCGFDCFEVSEVDGRAGGVWLCWQQARINVTTLRVHKQFIHCMVAWHSGLTCYVTAVYASPHVALRQEFWRETQSFPTTFPGPWLIAGDFNSLLGPDEKLGGEPPIPATCRQFGEWIDDCQLLDLGFKGSPFTWERGNV
ncbi:hypothetical protein Tsubulata_042683 [Turnera subulata]|uniref:CCHC-type domain-containing protein n=1 Tax=Turnera subulata TaxID=218843 RepID=A0A9Q0F1R7_9ROSI|nr:hypothetical protein Tsubulata_042683 [Turnera subulata]